MKTIVLWTLLASLFTQFTDAGCCAEAQSESPARMLQIEFEDLKLLVRPGPPATYKEEFAPAIKACREKIINYTNTHQGEDLDAANWGNAFESVYMTSAFREWKTCEQSEANVRQAWNTLAAARMQNPQYAIDLSMSVARWHIQSWVTLEPEACASLIDEIALRFLPVASSDAIDSWKFVRPLFEQSLVAAAAALPVERRLKFKQKREDALFKQLQDESVSINIRSNQIAQYASQLYSEGESSRGELILDTWWNTYGQKIRVPLFYSVRFHIACYGIGNWEKAREMYNCMEQLVESGDIPADDPLRKLVVNNYNKNISYSEAELKSRAVIFNRDRHFESAADGKPHAETQRRRD